MTPKEKAVDFILREYYPLRNKHNNKPNSCWFQSFVEKGINIALQEQAKEIFREIGNIKIIRNMPVTVNCLTGYIELEEKYLHKPVTLCKESKK